MIPVKFIFSWKWARVSVVEKKNNIAIALEETENKKQTCLLQ